jgi:hypothetical protein
VAGRALGPYNVRPLVSCAKTFLVNQHNIEEAAIPLLKTMIDPATPASVKVRAAEAIFSHATKAVEIEDIEARVSALEAATTAGVSR